MQILQGLFIAACTLLFLECSARTVVTLREDLKPAASEWFVYSDELGWERRPNFSGNIEGVQKHIATGNYTRKFDAQGYFLADSEQVGASHDPKILVLGDSTTFGWGVAPESSYAEVLDSLLPDISVINLGVNGYTSFQGYKVLERYLSVLNTEIIVVSFNFNDRRYVLSPDSMDSEAKFHRDMGDRGFSTLQQKVYLYRVLRSLLLKAGIIHDVDDAQKLAVDDLRMLKVRVPPDKYRENLVKMALMAKAHDIPIIFLLLNDNPLETQYLNRGLEFFEKAQYDLAVREFMIGARTINYSSDLARKFLANVYEKQNASDDIRKVVRINQPNVSLHGGRVLYRDAEYNEIMRDVAREYGSMVVEAGRVLNEDPSLYLDNCHLDERGHRIIANLLHAAVQDLMAKRQQITH